jgi:triosephosphate isomerase (TIM)
MRKKLVAGNWKMNGDLRFNEKLLSGILAGSGDVACEVLLCVPYPYLAQVGSRLQDSLIGLGAQNVSQHEAGAYTGEVSARMLADFSCRYVLVGHSERRTLFGESDRLVAEKCAAVLAAGMSPVLCVGEMLVDRQAGRTVEVVSRQLAAVIELLGVDAMAGVVVAYEPVWAIGTGLTATPGQAQEVHQAIRAQVASLSPRVSAGLRVLYGGSVKPQSAAELFAQPDIDGGLIGGAALVAEDFLAICRAAN